MLGPANRSQSSFHLLLRQSARRVPILDKNRAQLLHKDHDGGNPGLYLQVFELHPIPAHLNLVLVSSEISQNVIYLQH
ncbi:Uncharacterised protein [Acinetobacter baumannii]|nr:Uncharacterised protein [Acinetobacter baumannii]